MKSFARTNGHNMEVKLMELSVPVPDKNEVLLKVEAFGVGIHDRYFIPMDACFPYSIGIEGAGIIVSTDDPTAFPVGERVIFTTALQPQGGSWAQYAVAKTSTLITIPEYLSSAEAAGIPIAGKSALENIRELGLGKGDSLFIAGASGAIGSLVIQLAASRGIRVSGSASEKNHAYMHSLGLEKAVDYRDPDWQQKINNWSYGGVTAALAIQPGTGTGSIKVVRDNGLLITVSGDSKQVLNERNIQVRQMSHQTGQKEMSQLIKDIADKKIVLHIEKEYEFEAALEALEKVETRHAQGKSVVRVI